jgi:hypothetical protein
MEQKNAGPAAPEGFTPHHPVTANYRLLLRDLYLYWHFVRGYEQGIPLLNHGLVPKPVLRLLNVRLRAPCEVEAMRTEFEMERLYFLRRLLLQAGLLTVRENRLYAVDEHGYFAMPSLQRAHRCLHIWLNDRYWHDLVHLPGISIRPGPQPDEMVHPQLLAARRALVAMLSQETTGNWIPLSVFASALQLAHPDLFFSGRQRNKSTLSTAAGNLYGWDFRIQGVADATKGSLFQIESAAISRALAGPLHWLGIVDISWSQEHPQRLEGFRVHPIGAALLSQPAETLAHVTDHPGKVRIQPDFSIVAMEPVSEAFLLHLDRFALRESLDRAAIYRLTREATGTAMQHGMSAADILHVLETWAEVPQNVRYTLYDWERQAGRLRLHQHAIVLEVADATILDRLTCDETLSHSLRRLAPTIALVERDAFATVYNALVAAGELPLQSRPFANDDPPEKAWYVQGDTVLASRWRVPDHYLEHQLASYASIHDDGTIVFDPQRVRDAMAHSAQDIYSGSDKTSEGKKRVEQERDTIAPANAERGPGKMALELERLLEFLDRHICGGLPAIWRLRLRIWGGRYREALQIHMGPFLVLQDAQLLAELRADPAISPLLSSTLPEGCIVVRLHKAMLALLCDRLKAHEIAITLPEDSTS